MPHLETPPELADAVADWIGVYGAHSEECTEDKPCRCCFVVAFAERIRNAVTNERLLDTAGTEE